MASAPRASPLSAPASCHQTPPKHLPARPAPSQPLKTPQGINDKTLQRNAPTTCPRLPPTEHRQRKATQDRVERDYRRKVISHLPHGNSLTTGEGTRVFSTVEKFGTVFSTMSSELVYFISRIDRYLGVHTENLLIVAGCGYCLSGCGRIACGTGEKWPGMVRSRGWGAGFSLAPARSRYPPFPHPCLNDPSFNAIVWSPYCGWVLAVVRYGITHGGG